MQRRLTWWISIAFAALSVIAAGLYFIIDPSPPPERDPCSECIIDKAYDEEAHLNAEAFQKNLDAEIEAEVELKVSNQVSTELSSNQRLGVSEGQVTRTYNSILAANTTTTQHANLYRAVACAFDQLYCRSEVLSAEEKDQKREGVLRDYATEIYALLDQDNPLLAAGPSEEPPSGEPVPAEPIPEEPLPEGPTIDEAVTEEPVSEEPTPADTRPSAGRLPVNLDTLTHATILLPRESIPAVVRSRPSLEDAENSPTVSRNPRSEPLNHTRISESIRSLLPGTQIYDVVLLAHEDANADLVGALMNELRSTGLTVGRNVFTEDFMSRFHRQMEAGDWSFLSRLQLADRAHCICRIVPGELDAQPNFRLGRVFTTVRGPVTIELINVHTGKVLAKETIVATGRGEKVDRAAAEADYLKAIMANDQFRAIPFGRCARGPAVVREGVE